MSHRDTVPSFGKGTPEAVFDGDAATDVGQRRVFVEIGRVDGQQRNGVIVSLTVRCIRVESIIPSGREVASSFRRSHGRAQFFSPNGELVERFDSASKYAWPQNAVDAGKLGVVNRSCCRAVFFRWSPHGSAPVVLCFRFVSPLVSCRSLTDSMILYIVS